MARLGLWPIVYALQYAEPMLNVFTLQNHRLVQHEIEDAGDLAGVDPVWVDLDEPESWELAWVEERFGVTVPADALGEDLEESARFYEEEDGGLHLRTDFLVMDGAGAQTMRVAFILHGKRLISVHRADSAVFRLLRLRARRMPGLIEDGLDALLALQMTDAEYSSDALEGVYVALEAISQSIMRPGTTDTHAAEALAGIALQEDLNGRIRRNLMDTRRAVSFLMRSRRLGAEQLDEANQILRDIDSLDGHTAFLFDKINFLMSATVGFININQNKIIKLFSVASVALLPPTLIASIYGMNFKTMPELDWRLGYPFALLLMLVSVALPFSIFRRKGWLK
jgi:magnesium transporter